MDAFNYTGDQSMSIGLSLRNPAFEKGCMLILGNNLVAFAKGRSISEIGKNEVACKVLPSGDRAVLKHLVKKGSVSIKTLQDGELLRFRPGEEGDIEFNLEKNPEDSFSFCLYLSHPSDPTMRCYIMPEDDTTDTGVMVLRSGKRNYQGCYVFGSSIMVKFIK